MHLSSITLTFIFSHRCLLSALALMSLLSHTRSSEMHCRSLLCLLTEQEWALCACFSLIIPAQVHSVASTGIEFRVNGDELGHLLGHRQADLPSPVRYVKNLWEAGAHLSITSSPRPREGRDYFIGKS